MADEPPRKRVRYAISDGLESHRLKPILVHVGDDEQELYIHENLLCANSDFFQKALKKEWTEGDERKFKLPEMKVDIFKTWVQWLYTGRIFLTKEDDRRTSPQGLKSEECTRWGACYALGDFLQDHDFKDACIDFCIEAISSTTAVPFKLPRVVYAHSPRDSAHRQLAIDVFIKSRNQADWGKTPDAPIELYSDVLKHIGPDLVQGIKIWGLKKHFESVVDCKHHDHGPGKACYRTKFAF